MLSPIEKIHFTLASPQRMISARSGASYSRLARHIPGLPKIWSCRIIRTARVEYLPKSTGSAKYLDGYTGWNVATEEEGHYFPINVTGVADRKITVYNRTVGAKEGKELTLTDGSLDIAVFLDGQEDVSDLAENTFKIKVGDKAGNGKVYTIDFSGLTLLPKVASGTSVTVDDNGDTKIENDNGILVLPVDVEDQGKMEIAVTSATAGDITVDQSTDSAISSAITSAAKAVEVTIKIGDEKQFTDGTTLADPLIITIKGLTTAKTYHVFCVKDDSTVTYYGSKTLDNGATSIQFNTKHLCHFVAVEETDYVKAAVANMSVETDSGLDGSAPETYTVTVAPTTGGTATVDKSTASAGEEVTITTTNAAGYSLGTITVTKASGGTVAVTDKQFTMPAENVTVNVTFTRNTTPPTPVEGELKIEKADNSDSSVGLSGVKISGIKVGKYYVLRVAESAEKDERSVLFTFTGTLDLNRNGYSFSSKSGNHVTIFEFASAADLKDDTAVPTASASLTCE